MRNFTDDDDGAAAAAWIFGMDNNMVVETKPLMILDCRFDFYVAFYSTKHQTNRLFCT